MKQALVAAVLVGVPAALVWVLGGSAGSEAREVVFWMFGLVSGGLVLWLAWILAGEVLVHWGNERRRRQAVREYRARQRGRA